MAITRQYHKDPPTFVRKNKHARLEGLMRLFPLLLVGAFLSSIASADSYTVSLVPGAPNVWLYASGIDDAGVGIGYYYSTSVYPPVATPLREQNLTFYGTPGSPPSGPQSTATAISSNGLYTAGIYEPLTSGQSSFMYLQQGASAPQNLGLPADTFGFSTGPTSNITGVNNSGTVVANVSASLSGPFVAEVITNGVATILQFPGSGSTQVTGINDNGVVIGSAVVGTASSISAFVAFTYQNGVFTTIFSTPYQANEFFPMGINDSGEIVGIVDPYDIFDEYGALLNNGTLTNLNSFYTNNQYPYYPFQFAYAAGINNLGEIIGGDRDGSVLVAMPASSSLAPEPGTLGLLAVPVLLGAALRRLRRSSF